MNRDPQWRWKVAVLAAGAGLMIFALAGCIGSLLQAEREQNARLERQAALFNGPAKPVR